MKSTIKHVSETRALVTVVLGIEELKAAEQVALVRLGKNMKVAGFRKGKAPIAMVAKNADPAALSEEILNSAVSKAIADAYTENNLMPLDRPEVEIKKFVPGDTLEFTAESDILPEVKLGDYKKLKAKKVEVKVEKSDVDDVIKRIKQQFAEKKPVTRKAEMGDEAVIDYVGKKGDEEFQGGSATDYALGLGSGQFIPGFEEAIVGHATGEEFDVPLTFPKEYHSKELAGQKVVFSVKLKQLNEVVLPEDSDEFAAKVGEFTAMADLRKDIKAELSAQKEREAMDEARDDLIQQLVDKSKVAAPKVLIDDQVKSIQQDMFQNLMYQGMTMDQYVASKGYDNLENWEAKEATPLAEKRVKASLVLNELAKDLKIEVTPEQLNARLDMYRQQYANQPEMAKRFDEPEIQRDITNRLATELTVDKLVELNTK
jgi:trigger factor